LPLHGKREPRPLYGLSLRPVGPGPSRPPESDRS
jgi:hypothetical protein